MSFYNRIGQLYLIAAFASYKTALVSSSAFSSQSTVSGTSRAKQSAVFLCCNGKGKKKDKRIVGKLLMK